MYRKKGRGWTKHIDFMLLDVLCMQIAFIVSYIWRFGPGNPYTDKDYRILAAAFLLIDFFVEIVSDAFKNVLKRGYLDELIATCKHVVLVEILTTFFLFATQMGEIYSRMSYYIMIPIYILVSYLGRVVLKKIIKKRSFASSKKSLFVIAPEKLLEETLQGIKDNSFGYTQIVAAATDADLKGKTICEIPIVANHDGIVDYACEEWVDEVLIPPCAESEYPYEMADIFLEMGIAVHRGITKNKVMAGSFNQIEKIGDHRQYELCKHHTASCKKRHGHTRRTGRMHHHFDSDDICGTGNLYSITGTDFLRTGANRQKRKKVQDVQIQKYVHGCRGAKEGACGTKQGERRNDVQDGLRSENHRQQDTAGWNKENRHRTVYQEDIYR